MTATQNSLHATPPIWTRAFRWWLAQVRHMLPAVIFFFIGFNLTFWPMHQLGVRQRRDLTWVDVERLFLSAARPRASFVVPARKRL